VSPSLRVVVLTGDTSAALDGIGLPWETRPVRKGAAPDRMVREAFVRGGDQVVLAGVELSPEEVRQGLSMLPGADAVAWLDERPSPRWAAWWNAAVDGHFPGPRVLALGLWRHAWDALHNRGRGRTVRGLAVESALRLHHLGLDVRPLSGRASPGWSGRTGWEVARGVWWAHWRSRVGG